MKTTIIGIALAATALTTANALKCQKNATGVLATREKRFEHKFDYDGHPVAEWTQYYKMKDGKLVTSKEKNMTFIHVRQKETWYREIEQK